jgi:hypothetical protein
MQVPKKVQEEFTEDEKSCKHLAYLLSSNTSTMHGNYLSLCKFIREKDLDPKQVTRSCLAGGLSKERVSEIKRICFASEKIFKGYLNGKLSFRAALAQSRSGAKLDDYVKWQRFFSVFDRLVNKGGNMAPFFHVHEKQALIMMDLTRLETGLGVHKFKGWTVTIKEQQKVKHEPKPSNRRNAKRHALLHSGIPVVGDGCNQVPGQGRTGPDHEASDTQCGGGRENLPDIRKSA